MSGRGGGGGAPPWRWVGSTHKQAWFHCGKYFESKLGQRGGSWKWFSGPVKGQQVESCGLCTFVLAFPRRLKRSKRVVFNGLIKWILTNLVRRNYNKWNEKSKEQFLSIDSSVRLHSFSLHLSQNHFLLKPKRVSFFQDFQLQVQISCQCLPLQTPSSHLGLSIAWYSPTFHFQHIHSVYDCS